MMSAKHYPMRSDVREKKDSYLLEIDLPGCRKEDIKAYIDEGYLHIAASINREKEKKDGKFIRRECFSGEYERSFFVGSQVSQEDLKADYRHGVLRIRIPKELQEKKKRSIAIKG